MINLAEQTIKNERRTEYKYLSKRTGREKKTTKKNDEKAMTPRLASLQAAAQCASKDINKCAQKEENEMKKKKKLSERSREVIDRTSKAWSKENSSPDQRAVTNTKKKNTDDRKKQVAPFVLLRFYRTLAELCFHDVCSNMF